jgi:hypothetical protein
MRFRVALSALAALGLFAVPATSQDEDPVKEALKPFNEFVGKWKGSGENKTAKTDWKESAEWGWLLKGAKTPTLKVSVTGGKQFTEGMLTYLPDKKKYQLTAKEGGQEVVYLGEIKAKRLTLTREDPKTKDKYTIEMSTNNEGARFVYTVAKQTGGAGLARKTAEVSYSKEGVSLAGGKKAECIVTGGLGTMAVSYGGKTYYVCCSGCRDEFNANPKKYVDEYEKAKK